MIPRIDLNKITNQKILDLASDINNESDKVINKESYKEISDLNKKIESINDAIDVIIPLMKKYNISKIILDDISKVLMEFRY